MASPIIVEWLVKGIPDVQRASRTVQDTVLASERNTTRAAQREAQQRARLVQQEARDKAREIAKGVQAAEQASRAETRAIERAARDNVRVQRQASEEVERIQERARRNAVRSFERSEQEKTQAAAKWVKQREAEEAKATAQANSTRQRFASAIGAGAVAGVRRIGGIASQVGGLVSQLGGGFSVADSVQRGVALRHEAAVLSASTELAGPNARKISTNELVDKARTIGAQQGIDPSEVLKGFDEVKKLTGDLDKAMQVMPNIAKLSTATGGKLSEMSGLAANILAANPNISNKELDSQMRVFTRQGVVGGVEVPDFARYGSRLTAGASLFGGDASKNQATLGAIAQMSRQFGGAASPAEATMAAQRFATDVASHAKVLKAKGIDVSDGHGNLKDAQQILAAMVDKTGGDVTKLKEMGLNERGVKALTGVSAIYKNAGGGKKGEEAVKAEFAKYTSGVSEKEVNTASARVLGESDAKMEQIRQKFDQAISEKLIPKLLELMPVFEKMIPLFGDFLANSAPAFVNLLKSLAEFAEANKGIIQGIAAHPIGAIMAAEVGKSIVTANIGGLIRSLLSGGGAGGAGGAGGSGLGGALGAGAAAGLATAAVYKPGVDSVLAGQVGGQRRAGELTAMLKNGSAKDKADAAAEFKRAQGEGSYASAAVDASQLVWGGLNSLAGGKNFAADNLQKGQQAREISGNEELKALVAALDRNTAATAAHTTGPVAPNSDNRSQPLSIRRAAQ